MEHDYLKIAEQAKMGKAVENLMHLVDKTALREQHRKQDGKKAVGVDEVTKCEYNANLNDNLDKLIARMKAFSYKPQPVKRVYIPKIGSNKLRPLGMPAYEDKLVQGVMAEILTAIYETKFLDCSYGFRANRNGHDAIKALNYGIMKCKTHWVVDADIKGFFDNVNHAWLIRFLEHDIKDKRFIRYIKRFLLSGIMENGLLYESDKGTPQGGLISPILANVYLHYVLDLWFEKAIKPKLGGSGVIVRYADDFVCCFPREKEAREFYVMLKERLAKFGLEIADDKSKIINFGRFCTSKDSFDFLGFTHINGKSREGYYKVIHHTSLKKLKAKKQAAKEWLRKNMHVNKCELVKMLNIKLIGHYRYYGITDNLEKLRNFKRYVERQLYYALSRRSQKRLSWENFYKFLEYNPLTKPKIYVSLWQSK